MAAGGIAIVVIGPPEEEVEPFHATLAAPEGAIQSGFSTDALTFEADVPVELEFDNEDPGVGHNVQIFDGPDDSAPSALRRRRDHRAPDDDPVRDRPARSSREYFFHCRLHPATAMQGTITGSEGCGRRHGRSEGHRVRHR